MRFLDDVIERNPFPLKQIDDIVKNNRRIGLGVMGWADMLFQLHISYQSQEALELAEEVMERIRRVGHVESQALAEERGVFPRWSESIYRDKYPLRNSTVTTIAPTGTISIIADCSSGIEPIFGLSFKHRLGFQFFNPYFERIMKKEGYWSEGLKDHVRRHGTIGETNLPEELKKLFKTAHEISPEWHIRMQAAFQKYTDNAVSKTINLPNNATPDNVAEAYLLAYKTGCLGITVYRDGCKSEQVLTHGSEGGAKTAGGEAAAQPAKIKDRPQVLQGCTVKVKSPVGNIYVVVNENGGRAPFEVFTKLSKSGSDANADAEALGRVISYCLRMPSSIPETARIEQMIEQLRGIGGSRDIGYGARRIRSMPDAVGAALEVYMGTRGDRTEMAENHQAESASPARGSGNLCPECGSPTIKQEGCEKCSCGWSGC